MESKTSFLVNWLNLWDLLLGVILASNEQQICKAGMVGGFHSAAWPNGWRTYWHPIDREMSWNKIINVESKDRSWWTILQNLRER